MVKNDKNKLSGSQSTLDQSPFIVS